MDNTELCFTSAVALKRLLDSGELSPVELTHALLERIEAVNPVVNAYCTVTAEAALAQAQAAERELRQGGAGKPLLGLPVSIKDLIFTAGIRTTRGSLLYRDFVPPEDAPSVERVRAAGAIILGKTNTPEFGWRGTTDNRVFGPSRNPWNTALTPGGSSGGASAQVAAGLGPLALGTDGGGSVRIPASYTGVFGLKPSAGRIPVYPSSPTGDLSHVGPLTRTVADAALLLSVVAGPDDRDRLSLPTADNDYLGACRQGAAEGLPGLRIAWSADLGYAKVDPEVAALTAAAARRFAGLGAELEEAHPGFSSPAGLFNVFFFGGLAASLEKTMQNPEQAELLDPGLYEVARRGHSLSGLEFGRALIERQALWEVVRRFFDKYDLLLTPTMPQTAFELGSYGAPQSAVATAPADAALSELTLDWTPFSYPFNLTGQPAATVPCGFDSRGLPVGLQIVGRRHADKTVLRAAAAFEAAQPWAAQRPPQA